MPLKMISVAKSIGTSPLGIPRSWTRPPIRTAAKAWCNADGTPDISHTTSAPSPPVASSTARSTSSVAALIVTCAPMRPASANRVGFTSEAMTLAAPAARAIPTAKQPIGPHPTMNTVLPGISAVSTVWNALPIGSMMAPTSVGMPSSARTLVAGIVMNSANAPSRSTPMMRVFLQMWPLPVRHCRQWPQMMCPSAVTSWPRRSSVTPSPSATISPANSCPTTSGGLRRPCAQASQSAMCRSVPQTPACRTAISTSPGPARGLGTVVTVNPGARCALTMACMRARETWSGDGETSKDGAREAPVHLEHGAGNIAGLVRRQERDRGRDLLGLAHAPERDARDGVLHHFFEGAPLAFGAGLRQFGDALGRDVAGANHVHRDAFGRHFVGEGLGEPQHAGARRGGEDEARERLLGGHRREANDPPPLHFAHEGHGRGGEVHRREQVHFDRLAPRFGGLLPDGGGGRAGGVAEQDVEAPQLARHALD